MKTENFIYFFSYNATRLRVKSKLTQQDLAGKLGLKRTAIGAIEEGRALGIERVYLYSRFFNVPIDKLITEKLTLFSN